MGTLGVVMFAMGLVRVVEQSQPDYELYRAGRAIGVFGVSQFETIDNLLRGAGAAAFVAGVVLAIIGALQHAAVRPASPAPAYWHPGYPPTPSQWAPQQQWAPRPPWPPQQR